MTDKELIKALECCTSDENCESCPLHHEKIENACTLTVVEVYKEILALINRQQAEIERLQQETKNTNDLRLEIFENKSAFERIARIKAIKEFAERLKAITDKEGWTDSCEIDDLAKEMVGEQG